MEPIGTYRTVGGRLALVVHNEAGLFTCKPFEDCFTDATRKRLAVLLAAIGPEAVRTFRAFYQTVATRPATWQTFQRRGGLVAWRRRPAGVEVQPCDA